MNCSSTVRWVAEAGCGRRHSTCRLVSNLDAKEPRMRCSHGGVQNVLPLQALRLSSLNRWQSFCSRAPQTRRSAVRTLTYAEDRHARTV